MKSDLMELNLPIYQQTASCQNLLIAGMGGGFDLFCGLPLYFALRQQGKNVHLANLTSSLIRHQKHGERLSPTMIGIRADDKSILPYFPEYHLSCWFQEVLAESVPIWCFEMTGARPLLENYRKLVERLSIDGILLVDGGVDSLMHGDEVQPGSILEDSISLAAVNQLTDVPLRMMSCIGLGAEQDISYYRVFENIAELAHEGAFFGNCSLTRQMEAYQRYEDAIAFVQERMKLDTSIINTSIISSVKGHYGDFHLTEKTKGSKLWISPLMPIYWFFDLLAICERNLFIERIAATLSPDEVLQSLAFNF